MNCWHFWRDRHAFYDDKHRERLHCMACCDRLAAQDAAAVLAGFLDAHENAAAKGVPDVTPDEG